MHNYVQPGVGVFLLKLCKIDHFFNYAQADVIARRQIFTITLNLWEINHNKYNMLFLKRYLEAGSCLLLGHLQSKKAIGVHYCSAIDSDNTYGWDLFS